MRIGIFLGDLSGEASQVEVALTETRRVADAGFTSIWMPQIFGLDALTTLAVIGSHVPDIELATGVVPIYPRHPGVLAQQALTVQSAAQLAGSAAGRRGRLTLGIGLSHQLVVESMYGYSFDRPASYMDEYLQALAPLLRGERSELATERITANLALDIAVPEPPSLVVAALGERMIRLAAEHAEGTVTWMTGERTLAEHTVPTMRATPGGADKRVIAALPVAVTDDVAAAKARAAKIFVIYGQLPSYRAMLDREGATGPEDVAIVGSSAEVTERITSMIDSGVTEFVAVPFSRDDAPATFETLRELLDH